MMDALCSMAAFAAEVGVVMLEHLGVIGGEAHEDQQADGAEQQVASGRS